MTHAHGYAAHSPTTPLVPFSFERREPRDNDVAIDILHCGVCHSDLHTARGEWGGVVYPCVPGHEIVGRVRAVGASVAKVAVGDLVGVGCMVDACRRCDACNDGLEQYCENGFTATYDSKEQGGGPNTLGGYSDHIVVDAHFVLKIKHPESQLAAVAPLLCAGITTYSPLREWKVGPGSIVGVVGLGGLGHMGVKLAVAMGAHVVLFTTSPNKTEDAKRLGAAEVVVSKNANEMEAQRNRFDFILNTVAAAHDLDAFLGLLKRDGTMTLLGVPPKAHPSPNVAGLIFKRRRLAGSLIGGIQETQEMLDFCAEHGIVADIEPVAMDGINGAYDRMVASDVKYRFVIDMSTLAASR